MKVSKNNGFVFPSFIQQFYFTDIIDLKMTSNYKQFAESGFAKHLKMLSFFIPNFAVFDMTGNIGCDAVNFSTVLKQTPIFTCELDKLKAQCLKKNCESIKNIFVFNGNSDTLLNAIMLKDFKTVSKMCISDNHKNLIPEILFMKWLINIDPPFGETYDKSNPTCELEFCGKDIIDYLRIYDKKYSINILEYIIKSPTNWNYLQRDTDKSNIGFYDFLEFSNTYVNTKNSAFVYNVFTSWKLCNTQPIHTKQTGGMLFESLIENVESSDEYKELLSLNRKFVKTFGLKTYITSMNENMFNEFITNLVINNDNMTQIDSIIMKYLSGIGIFHFSNGKQFFVIPHCVDKNFAKHLLFHHLVYMFFEENKKVLDSIPNEFIRIFKYLYILKLDITHGVDLKQIFLLQSNIYEIYEKYSKYLDIVKTDSPKTMIESMKSIYNLLKKTKYGVFIRTSSKSVVYHQLSGLMFPIFSHREILDTFKKIVMN